MDQVKVFAIVLLVSALVAGLANCSIWEGQIVATTEILLSASPDGVATRLIPKGAKLVVTGCVDTKHYIIPQVEDAAGKRWFIIDGEFDFVGTHRPWGC